MEDAYLIEQKYGHATSFALADFCAKPSEERFDVLPGDVCTGRVCEDGFKSSKMGTLHPRMVPESGTARNELEF
jgi:hypothetical protein